MENPAIASVLASDNLALIKQTIDLVQGLGDEAYCGPGTAFHPSGIGCHVRHIHDHYRLFLDGFAARRVDYERRARDTRIEQDRGYAMAMLAGLGDALGAIPEGLADSAIEIQSACGLADDQRWCRSTVRRELEYLVMHDVHHHALIAFILHSRNMSTPEGFGLAPSTRRYLQGQQTCAR